MDMLKPRPVMPGTTLAPPPMGKTSVYEGTKKPHFTEEFLTQKRIREEELAMARSQGVDEMTLQVGNVPNSVYYSTEMRKRQQKAVNKAISQLPYTTREQVETFVSMALNTAESTSKELETTRREINRLRKELGSKSTELELAKRNNLSLRQKLTTAESNIDVMKEEVLSKQAFHLRNKHILEKVSNTNRLLIGSIEAMGGEVTKQPKLTRNDSTRSGDGGRTLLKPIEGAPPLGDSYNDLSAIIRPSSSQEVLNSRPSTADDDEAGPATKKLAAVPGDDSGLDKLKESLLRVTRQHLISQTANVNLDKEVLALRAEIKSLEAANRSIKNELDELRSVKSGDSPVNFAVKNTELNGEEGEEEKDDARAREGKKVRAKFFGKIDQRFDALLKRDALDPWNGFMAIRRILDYCSNAPTNGTIEDIANYAVSSSLNKIFDAEGVVLFLKPSVNDFDSNKQVIYKYTARSPKSEEIEGADYERSITGKCFRTTHSQRLNSLARNANFKKDVDGVKGLVSRRLLATPIFNLITGDMLGCIMLVNKQSSGDAFVEADELLMMLVCDQFSSLFTQGFVLEKTLKSMTVYKNTLECSVAAFDLIGKRDDDPSTGGAAVTKEISSSGQVSVTDIITSVENSIMKALSCTRAKVFLATSQIRDQEAGNLLFLDNSNRNRTSARSAGDVSLTSPVSGIAGQVYTTRETIEIGANDSELKARLNPLADLDVTSKPMVVTPILDSQGEVIAVLELIPSSRSPHMTIAEGISSPTTIGNKIIFSQAAQWVAFAISPSLQHMLFYVDRAPAMPAWFPLKYSALQITPFDVNNLDSAGTAGQASDSDSVGTAESNDDLDDLAPLIDARKIAQNTLSRRKSSVTTIQIQREQELEIARLSASLEELSSSAKRLQTTVDGKDAEMAASLKRVEDESSTQISVANKAREQTEKDMAKLQQSLEEQKIKADARVAELVKEREQAVASVQAKLETAKAEAAAAVMASDRGDKDGVAPATAPAPAPTGASVDVETDPRYLAVKKQMESAQEEQKLARARADQAEASVLAATKTAEEATQAAATASTAQSSLLKEKAHLESTLSTVQAQVASLETQLNEASSGQGALQAAQALNKQLSTDLEKLRADLLAKEITAQQLTEQLVKMANDQLDKSVATAKSAASSVASKAPSTKAPPEISPSTKMALGLDDLLGSTGGGGGGDSLSGGASGVKVEGSIDTMGSEGLDEINALLAMAAGDDGGEQAGSGSAPGSRPLSARPPGSPPVSRPKTGEGAADANAHTHMEGTSLPAPWEHHQDEHGNIYYHNPESGETSWEIPQHAMEGFTDSTEAYVGITLGEEYTQMFDTEGNEYFVNHATGESIWSADLPVDVCERYADVLNHRPASSNVQANSAEGMAAAA